MKAVSQEKACSSVETTEFLTVVLIVVVERVKLDNLKKIIEVATECRYVMLYILFIYSFSEMGINL